MLDTLIESSRPEEWNIIHREFLSEHIQSGDLSLVDSLIVMLNSSLLSRVPVRITGNISSSINIFLRGFKINICFDTMILNQSKTTFASKVKSPTKLVTGLTPVANIIKSVATIFLFVKTMFLT